MCLLRYPGGKQRAANRIVSLLPQGIDTLYSPFFGGGAVELEWLARNPGGRVIGRDLFEPLTEFWFHVLRGHGSGMATYIRRYCFPIDKDGFALLQNQLRARHGTTFLRACWFYVLNRASFSGATLSGGMGNGDRFTESSLSRLANFVPPRGLEVIKANVFDHLRRRIKTHQNNVAVFLDPPYLLKNSKLYGDKGSTHEGFDHAKLARQLKRLPANWMVTYNDDPTIRSLYEGNRMLPATWKYGMSADKDGRELFIFNYEESSK